MRSEIMIPFRDFTGTQARQDRPYFEMRTYTYVTGALPNIIKVWEKAIPARLQYSPLVCGRGIRTRRLNKFVHIWPYPSLDARNHTRTKAAAAAYGRLRAKKLGTPEYQLTAQENKI